MIMGTFWKFSKTSHIFKEKCYEIVKIFREFGQISSFLLLNHHI
jgi:hypothetical protein